MANGARAQRPATGSLSNGAPNHQPRWHTASWPSLPALLHIHSFPTHNPTLRLLTSLSDQILRPCGRLEVWLDPLLTFSVSLTRSAHQFAANRTLRVRYAHVEVSDAWVGPAVGWSSERVLGAGDVYNG